MIRKGIRILILLLSAFLIFSGIYFYRKAHRPKVDVQPITEQSTGMSPVKFLFRREYDLESSEGLQNTGVIGDSKALSGKMSCELNQQREYGVNFIYPVKSFDPGTEISNVTISSAVWTENPDEAAWVLEILDQDGKNIYWNSVPFSGTIHHWDTITSSFDIDQKIIHDNCTLKFYPWNKKGATIWFDNICFNFYGREEIREARSPFMMETNFFYDFEDGKIQDNNITDKRAHSGKWSVRLKGKDTYSPVISRKISEVSDGLISKVSASAWIFPEEKNPDIVLTFTINSSDGKEKYWSGKSTEKLDLPKSSWQKLNAVFGIPDDIQSSIRKDDELRIYLWNRSRFQVFADDIEIVYGEEPDRPGISTFADMNLKSREAYEFDRYHPPYPSGLLQAMPLRDEAGKPLNESSLLSINPLDQCIVLHSENGDLILKSNHSGIEVYTWCRDSSVFLRSANIRLNDKISEENHLLAIDVNGDGNSELLVKGSVKSIICNIAPDKIESCNSGINEIHPDTIFSFSTGVNCIYITGNFYPDRSEELLCIDSLTGKWKMFGNRDGKFALLSNGQNNAWLHSSNNSFICGKFFPGKGTTQVLETGTNNNDETFSCFEYSITQGKFNRIHFKDEKQYAGLFNIPSIFHVFSNPSTSSDNILAEESTNRHNYRLIRADDQGFYVSEQLGFTGYTNGYNPKYYEYSRLITGSFTGQASTEFLFVLKNCADKNFDGIHCNTYNGIEDLPDRVQMYKFRKN